MTASYAFLKPGREKSVRRRHPWIFSGAVQRVVGEPDAGATVDVVDAERRFLARTAYSPASQIRFRVWTFDRDEAVDAEFFRRRLARAIDSRRRLGLLGERRACRVVFAESDGLPGLIVDYYAGELVCQFLSVGAERWRDTIVALLVELISPTAIYERSEASVRKKEGLASRRGALFGSPASTVEIDAAGLRLTVDIAGGQKTGAYLDQQVNRGRVAAYASGARVLDAFCYSGGFGLASLVHGGAASATLVDSSSEAIVLAEREAVANGVADRCRFEVGNAFEALRGQRDAGERFDVVVLDPPKFVHSAGQLAAGSRGYKDINMLGLALVREGGVLATFSCSGHVDRALFQKIVAGAAVDAGRSAQILEVLGQPPDHPIALEFPEAEYLKGLILRVH